MANLYRKIGVNVYTFMQKAKLTPEELADRMSYSLKDIWNIIEGKVMIPPIEIDRIASMLGVSKEDLVSHESEQLVPNLEFMKEFSNPDSLDKVLDLMDEYVEIREAI
ncbi:MAG: helix-turn-helix domain-containing protein [Eubacterium sp.]|nr:helix-turn-helix domain-containing protein [Eubacterium sp.]